MNDAVLNSSSVPVRNREAEIHRILYSEHINFFLWVHLYDAILKENIQLIYFINTNNLKILLRDCCLHKNTILKYFECTLKVFSKG